MDNNNLKHASMVLISIFLTIAIIIIINPIILLVNAQTEPSTAFVTYQDPQGRFSSLF
jgi:hypothetical protein